MGSHQHYGTSPQQTHFYGPFSSNSSSSSYNKSYSSQGRQAGAPPSSSQAGSTPAAQSTRSDGTEETK